MAEVIQTDYYQREWSVLKREVVSRRSVVARSAVLLFVAVVVVALVKWLNDLAGLVTLEFFWMMVLFVVVDVIVLGSYWFRLARTHMGELHNYGINRDRLVTPKRTVPIALIKRDETMAVVEQKKEDLSADVQGDLAKLELRIPTKDGQVLLEFPEKTVLKKVMRALEEYLA